MFVGQRTSFVTSIDDSTPRLVLFVEHALLFAEVILLRDVVVFDDGPERVALVGEDSVERLPLLLGQLLMDDMRVEHLQKLV